MNQSGLILLAITLPVFLILINTPNTTDRFTVGNATFILTPNASNDSIGGFTHMPSNTVVLYTDRSVIDIWAVCNHEMIHVAGKRHDTFTFWEQHGLVPHQECNEVAARIILQ